MITANNQTEIENLQQSLAQIIETFRSANELLGFNKELCHVDETLAGKIKNIKKLQRDFLLDSFQVNRFHKEYKEWENKDKDKFIDNEIKGYNKKLGQMSRLNFETEKLDKEFENLRETVKLPVCKLSIQTVKQYEEGKLLEHVAKNAIGEYPSSIDISELFSLDPSSNLPPPDFKVFNRLLNIEYKLRIQRKVKYEILLSVKQQLTTKNKKWSSRDSDLNYFMNRKLIDVMEEVEKIRKSEYEDLKDYDYDNNEEEEEEEEIREQDFDDEESLNENEHENAEEDDDDVSVNDNEENLQVDIEADAHAEEENVNSQLQANAQEKQQSDSASEVEVTNENSADTAEPIPVGLNDDNDDFMNVDS